MNVKSQLEAEVIAGRYHLTARIGSGGMGDVYRARDTVLSRTVALKLLPQRLAADEGFVARFRTEAQSAARLSHPNVVQVHDWGESGSTYYMVMEHVRGKNLREIVSQRGPLHPRHAAQIAENVLTALTAAHGQGLIHRDIKPENILVSIDGVAKVADFGIAKAKDDQATGGMLGTVAYAAPELARGPQVDARSDLYSLGCVLYEMLTGEKPFQGDAAHVLQQHLQERVPAPSGTEPSVPESLDRIVLKATHPDPQERYASAAEMAAEVRAVMGGLADAPPLAELTYDLTDEVPVDSMQTAVVAPRRKRRWKRWIAIGVVLALLVTGVVVYRPAKLPDTEGMPLDEARSALSTAGYRITMREVFSNDAPDGDVVSTDPPAGRWLLRGSKVEIVVSKGPRLTDVPSLTGMSIDAAKQAIADAGLSLGTITEKNDRAAKGSVLEQAPQPGRARRGDPVNLTISLGPKVADVPDVVNRSADEAKKLLTGAGFEVTEEQVNADAASGTVVEQTPPAGTKAEQGTKVHIKVSKGPAPFAMPDVRNKTCADAKAQLEAAGLVVETKNAGGPAPCGTRKVIEQDPLPGATVRKGQEATLYLA